MGSEQLYTSSSCRVSSRQVRQVDWLLSCTFTVHPWMVFRVSQICSTCPEILMTPDVKEFISERLAHLCTQRFQKLLFRL